MSLLCYYIICTWISPITGALVDVPVYPPKRGDLISSEGSDYDEAKGGVVTKTMEV
jgi:hypothetical protein